MAAAAENWWETSLANLRALPGRISPDARSTATMQELFDDQVYVMAYFRANSMSMLKTRQIVLELRNLNPAVHAANSMDLRLARRVLHIRSYAAAGNWPVSKQPRDYWLIHHSEHLPDFVVEEDANLLPVIGEPEPLIHTLVSDDEDRLPEPEREPLVTPQHQFLPIGPPLLPFVNGTPHTHDDVMDATQHTTVLSLMRSNGTIQTYRGHGLSVRDSRHNAALSALREHQPNLVVPSMNYVGALNEYAMRDEDLELHYHTSSSLAMNAYMNDDEGLLFMTELVIENLRVLSNHLPSIKEAEQHAATLAMQRIGIVPVPGKTAKSSINEFCQRRNFVPVYTTRRVAWWYRELGEGRMYAPLPEMYAPPPTDLLKPSRFDVFVNNVSSFLDRFRPRKPKADEPEHLRLARQYHLKVTRAFEAAATISLTAVAVSGAILSAAPLAVVAAAAIGSPLLADFTVREYQFGERGDRLIARRYHRMAVKHSAPVEQRVLEGPTPAPPISSTLAGQSYFVHNGLKFEAQFHDYQVTEEYEHSGENGAERKIRTSIQYKVSLGKFKSFVTDHPCGSMPPVTNFVTPECTVNPEVQTHVPGSMYYSRPHECDCYQFTVLIPRAGTVGNFPGDFVEFGTFTRFTAANGKEFTLSNFHVLSRLNNFYNVAMVIPRHKPASPVSLRDVMRSKINESQFLFLPRKLDPTILDALRSTNVPPPERSHLHDVVLLPLDSSWNFAMLSTKSIKFKSSSNPNDTGSWIAVDDGQGHAGFTTGQMNINREEMQRISSSGRCFHSISSSVGNSGSIAWTRDKCVLLMTHGTLGRDAPDPSFPNFGTPGVVLSQLVDVFQGGSGSCSEHAAIEQMPKFLIQLLQTMQEKLDVQLRNDQALELQAPLCSSLLLESLEDDATLLMQAQRSELTSAQTQCLVCRAYDIEEADEKRLHVLGKILSNYVLAGFENPETYAISGSSMRNIKSALTQAHKRRMKTMKGHRSKHFANQISSSRMKARSIMDSMLYYYHKHGSLWGFYHGEYDELDPEDRARVDALEADLENSIAEQLHGYGRAQGYAPSASDALASVVQLTCPPSAPDASASVVQAPPPPLPEPPDEAPPIHQFVLKIGGVSQIVTQEEYEAYSPSVPDAPASVVQESAQTLESVSPAVLAAAPPSHQKEILRTAIVERFSEHVPVLLDAVSSLLVMRHDNPAVVDAVNSATIEPLTQLLVETQESSSLEYMQKCSAHPSSCAPRLFTFPAPEATEPPIFHPPPTTDTTINLHSVAVVDIPFVPLAPTIEHVRDCEPLTFATPAETAEFDLAMISIVKNMHSLTLDQFYAKLEPLMFLSGVPVKSHFYEHFIKPTLVEEARSPVMHKYLDRNKQVQRGPPPTIAGCTFKAKSPVIGSLDPNDVPVKEPDFEGIWKEFAEHVWEPPSDTHPQGRAKMVMPPSCFPSVAKSLNYQLGSRCTDRPATISDECIRSFASGQVAAEYPSQRTLVQHINAIFRDMCLEKGTGYSRVSGVTSKRDWISRPEHVIEVLVRVALLTIYDPVSVSTWSPWDLFQAGILLPEEVRDKGDPHKRKKSDADRWRLIWSTSTAMEVVTRFVHQPQNEAELVAFQNSLTHSEAFPLFGSCIGMGHDDEGIRHMSGAMKRMLGGESGVRSDNGTFLDASAWDISVSREMWQADSKLRQLLSFNGGAPIPSLITIANLGTVLSAHLIVVGNFLYQVDHFGIMGSGIFLTASSNSHMRQLVHYSAFHEHEFREMVTNFQMEIATIPPAISAIFLRTKKAHSLAMGDDLHAAGKVQPEHTQYWQRLGLKLTGKDDLAPVLSNLGEPIEFTSHDYDLDEDTALFKNFEKLLCRVAHTDKRLSAEQVRGMRFALRHTPEPLAILNQMIKHACPQHYDVSDEGPIDLDTCL